MQGSSKLKIIYKQKKTTEFKYYVMMTDVKALTPDRTSGRESVCDRVILEGCPSRVNETPFEAAGDVFK